MKVGARDRKHQLADAPRRQRIGGNAACRRVDGPSRLQRVGQRRRQLRLDADDPDAARVPGRDSANQPAAADSNENGVERRLLIELQPERRLSEQRLRLIERVDLQRARSLRPPLACRERIGVAVAADLEVGAVRSDALDLGGGRDDRHEDFRRHLHRHRCERHRGAMIAARRRDDARRSNGPRQQMREGAAGLERPGALQLLQLQRDAGVRDPEIASVHVDDRRAADVRRYQTMDALDVRSRDRNLLVCVLGVLCVDAHRRHPSSRSSSSGWPARVSASLRSTSPWRTSSASDSSNVKDPCFRVIVIS